MESSYSSPRDVYDDDIGPYFITINNKNYKRTIFTLLNERHQKLCCSFLEPFDEEREYDRLPCMYMYMEIVQVELKQ